MSQLVPIPSPGIPLLYGDAGAPVVVIVPDSFGRLPWLEPYATAMAARGFRVAVLDLYGGFCTTDSATAYELNDRLGRTAAMDIVERTLVDATGGSTPAAVVGFASGGTSGLRIAQTGAIPAVVSYYGSLPVDERAIIPSAVLLHWAEEDVAVPSDEGASLTAALQNDGTLVTEYRYLGTERGFANASIPRTLNARAAALAFARTIVFLEKHLIH